MVEHGPGMADDVTLVQAVAIGSDEALAALYDRHAGGVHAVAIRMTGDRTIAEEVVQETFLALWNRAELFDPALASLATWLRAIARNRTLDKLRAAGRRPTLVSLGGGTEADDDRGVDRPGVTVLGGASLGRGPEEAALAGDLRVRVAEALAAMPDDERTVIILAYRDDMTQTEIAERLGWPLGTVKTRTRRALSRLRGILGPEAGPLGLERAHEDHDGSR